jgi:hypothetical protein
MGDMIKKETETKINNLENGLLDVIENLVIEVTE